MNSYGSVYKQIAMMNIEDHSFVAGLKHQTHHGLSQQWKNLILIQDIFAMNPLAENLIRRIQFWGYEVAAKALSEGVDNPAKKLQLLCDFFFKNLRFTVKRDDILPLKSDLFLNSVLPNRCGHVIIIGTLLSALGTHLDLKLDWAKSKYFGVLKVKANQESFFLDLYNGGSILEQKEVLDLLNSLYQNQNPNQEYQVIKPDWLEDLPIKDVVIAYLKLLEQMFVKEKNNLHLLTLYSLWHSISPSSIAILPKRALLHLEMGAKYQALCDLKRYFLFCDPQRRPQDILHIYTSLKNELEFSN